jgi:hypothetical protein
VHEGGGDFGSTLTGYALREVEKLAAKDAAEDLDREEEGILRINPVRVAWIKAAGGNDAMQMRMQGKGLSPGVQNRKESQLRARCLWSAATSSSAAALVSNSKENSCLLFCHINGTSSCGTLKTKW